MKRPSNRTAYTALIAAGFAAVVLGIALVAPPLALVIGGFGCAAFGLVGLGLEVRRTEVRR